MNWQEFMALLTLATAMSFSPGPNTTLSTALAANHGLKSALPFIFAVPVGWLGLLTICSFGLGALVLAVPILSWGVKLGGIAYLLWLAFKIARSHTVGQAPSTRLNVTFWQGTALQFVNIKAWMLALAIVSGWVAGQADMPARLAVVMPVMLVFAFVSNLTYAVAGVLLRDWLAGPEQTGKRLTRFNYLMAAVLVLTAFWMFTL